MGYKETNTEVLSLIEKIKNHRDSFAFEKLKEKYISLCHEMAHRTYYPEDFAQEIDITIYKCVLSFDPKRSKFSTYLANQIRFFCLKKINGLTSKIKLNYTGFLPDTGEYVVESKTKNINLVNDILRKIDEIDERAKKIFELRYLTPTNGSLTPWREIGAAIGISGQSALNIHNKIIEKFKKEINID